MAEIGPTEGSLVNRSPSESFPTIHFSGPEELGLPKSGKMEVEFKVTREVESETKGKHWYECSVEVRKILKVEETRDERPSKRDTSTEDNLDRLASEYKES